MLGVIVLFIIVAGVAYAIRHVWVSRREAREYGRHMHVRYAGHAADYEPRTSSTADFGVAREPDRRWQYEAPSPSTLDLLYEQMSEQQEGYRRRERERERDLGY